jgi:hypothetical protein
VAVYCISPRSCRVPYLVPLTELGVVISGNSGVVDELVTNVSEEYHENKSYEARTHQVNAVGLLGLQVLR